MYLVLDQNDLFSKSRLISNTKKIIVAFLKTNLEQFQKCQCFLAFWAKKCYCGGLQMTTRIIFSSLYGKNIFDKEPLERAPHVQEVITNLLNVLEG